VPAGTNGQAKDTPIQVQLTWSLQVTWDLDPGTPPTPQTTPGFSSDQASASLDFSSVGASNPRPVSGVHTAQDQFDHAWATDSDGNAGTLTINTTVGSPFSIGIDGSGSSTGTWIGGSRASHGKASLLIDLAFQLPNASVWTGKGPDNLWSDGKNWLSGVAPIAGADLEFPTGAQQLANVNDLSFGFNSVTIQDSYQFSGQPLSVTGAFDVQRGSTVLNASATLDGASTIESGASLAIGAADTLTANSNLSVLGDAIVGKASNFMLGPSGILNLLSGGGFDTSGITKLLGQTTLADGSSWAAHTPSQTFINGAFTTGSKSVKFDNGTKLTVAANLSLLANSQCDVDGDWSINKGVSLSAATGCSLTSSGKFSLLGQAQFGKNSSFTLNATGNMDVAGSGSIDADGSMNLHGKTTLAKNSTWDAHADSDTVMNGALKTGGNMTFDNNSKLAWNASFRGEVLANANLTTAGHTTSNVSSILTVDANAKWVLPSGQADIHGTCNVMDKANCEVDFGAKLYQYDLSVLNLGGQMDNYGDYKAFIAANPFQGAKLIFSANGKLNDKGIVNIGFKDQVLGSGGVIKTYVGATYNNQGHTSAAIFVEGDATTVAAGAILDVSRALTVTPNGHLDIFGTVILEPGAVYIDQGVVTVEPGGVFQKAGAPADIARLLFLTQPGNVSPNGVMRPFQVLALDQFGNRVNGGVVTLMVVPAMAHGVPSSTVVSTVHGVAVNGVATFTQPSVAIRGRYRLRADVGSSTVFSEPFTVGLFGRLN
jgi:hypothetical protein